MKNIPEGYLRRDFARARAWWGGLIDHAERRHGIPRRLLYAVYSRETNLGRHWRTPPPMPWPAQPSVDDLTYFVRNAGDGGHGHGIGQVDDRSHDIPADWSTNVDWQVARSAEVLAAALAAEAGDVVRAANRYNSGQGETSRTTGKDYGPDVVERWQLLVREFPPDAQEAPVARIIQEHLLADAHPELARRFRAGCRRFGGEVRVNSVLRDTALQRQFSDCHQTKRRTGKCPPGCERSNCAPANAPGTSNHEPHGEAQKSLAIDAEPVNENWPAFHAALRAEGLVFPIPSEDWHIQCRETPSPSYEPGSENRLPAATAPSKEDQLFSKSPVHTVHIIASHSGLLLTSSGEHHGAGVIQRRADGSLNQRWEVWGHDDGLISLVNRAGGFALDRPDYSTEAGTFLQVARTEHNAAQRWSRDSFKPPLARLWAPGTNRCMDVHMRSVDDGAGVQLWYGLAEDQDPRHQQFILAPTV